MAPVTLPPSFHNAFWSADYRTGLDVLFKQLEAGIVEDDDLADFIDSQVKAHYTLSSTLIKPPLPTSHSSSSSLQHTLLTLRGASCARGEAHRALAVELEQKILVGFKSWKDRHEDRVKSAKEDVLGKGGVVQLWEKESTKLANLRQTYLMKSRAADDSEDDAKFAPATIKALSPPDAYTTSPLKQSPLKRSGTVADRISEKLRSASIASSNSPTSPTASSGLHKTLPTIDEKVLPDPPVTGSTGAPSLPPIIPMKNQTEAEGMMSPSSPTKEDAFIPPTDPHGKPTISSTNAPTSKSGVINSTPLAPEIPQQPILLSGLSLPPQTFKDLLRKFQAYLLVTPAPGSGLDKAHSSSSVVLASRQKSTIIGTYDKTFSGEEVIGWLRDNLEGLGGEWERCEDAASELQKMGHISRIGVGRGFDPSAETFYTLKVNLADPTSGNSTVNAVTASVGSVATNLNNIGSMGGAASSLAAFTSPLSPTTTAAIPGLIKSYLPASLAPSDEPMHVRLRKEAVKADEAYKEGVRSTEEKRLEMEQRVERGLRLWERWERERLSVVRTVLKQYEEALAKLPGRLRDIQKGTTLAVEAYNPDADLKALIEGNRTGPFRPRPHVYESFESDVLDVNFGIDLRRWSGDHGWRSAIHAPPRPKGAIPEVLEAMLKAVSEMYGDLPDEERRRSWIYEVPLSETHMLRNAINNPQLSVEDMINIAKKFNVPVVAGTVKLYLLELNPPTLGWEGWEDAKAVYPSVGADQERDMTSAVTSVLSRLPGVQLFVLNAIVSHFKELVESTKSEESNDVYITKLSLSVGRCILRPQYETELTIQDRTPSLFLADLINHYDAVFPSLLEKKKKEADRVMPVRKRTALVDQRMSRSRLSVEPPESSDVFGDGRVVQPATAENESEATLGAKADLIVPQSTSTSALGLVEASEPESVTDQILQQSELSVPTTNVQPGDNQVKVVPASPGMLSDPQVGSQQTLAQKSAPTSRSVTPVPVEDESLMGGAASVKRATSGETSRLRGPRGARGPRTAPGKVPSHTASSSISGGMGSGGEGGGFGPGEGGSSDGGKSNNKSTVIGDFPRQGTHSTRGSVSAIAAQFEQRK